MKHLQQFFRVIACLVVGLVFLGWAQTTDGHAATLSNGLYQVPMKIIKADSTATSDANQFFGKTAVVRVNHTQVTILITSNGAKYIKKMTVAGQAVTLVKTVDHQALYQFNLTTQTSPLTTAFSLTTPMGAMKEQARLTLNWAKAKSVSKSVATTDLIAQAETLAKANASNQSSSVTVPKSTTTKPTAIATAKKTIAATEYWRYQVLQGTKMTKSEADQYYTDVATVTPKGTGYQVTLHVKYAKSLKLGPKADQRRAATTCDVRPEWSELYHELHLHRGQAVRVDTEIDSGSDPRDGAYHEHQSDVPDSFPVCPERGR